MAPAGDFRNRVLAEARRGLPILASFALAACSTPAPVPVEPPNLLNDAAFAPSTIARDPAVFVVSPAMQDYLRRDIARQIREQGPLRGLVSALESSTQLKLEYDTAVTRTAAEAFEARAGNCLSLTVMTAALARELGLSVSFQRVFSEPLWTRSDDTLFASGHVNILLQGAAATGTKTYDRVKGVVVDFTPGVDLLRLRSQLILDHTVTAMFMNNRAAEALRGGANDEAYWWARGATLQDPRFLEAFNTLGVIYARHGDLDFAERTFRHVLAHESENVSAIANLAGVFERQGRKVAALELRERLRRIEAQPPFHFFDLGIAALKRKDYAAAREHFTRELSRNAFFHEAHFGLAVALLGLGELAPARRQLAAALETSTNRRDHDIYAAKLAWLRSNQPD